jgi:hypothetical protein
LATSRGEGRSSKNPQWLRADPSAFASPVDRFSKTQTPLIAKGTAESETPVSLAAVSQAPPGAICWPNWSLGTSLFSSRVLRRRWRYHLLRDPCLLGVGVARCLLRPHRVPQALAAARRRPRIGGANSSGLRSTAQGRLYERPSMLSRPGEEFWQRYRARGPCDFFAVLNENEARDTADVEVGRQIGCRFSVDLY